MKPVLSPPQLARPGKRLGAAGFQLPVAAALVWLQYPIIRFACIGDLGPEHAAETPPLRFLFKLTLTPDSSAAVAPIGKLAGDAAKIAALRFFGSLSTTDAARCILPPTVWLPGVQWISVIGLAMLPTGRPTASIRRPFWCRFSLRRG